MFLDREAAFFGNAILSLLDLGVVELFYLAALKAYQVVVMITLVEFENRLARLEIVAFEQAGLLELRQHAIDGGEPDVHALADQQTIDILRGQVTLIGTLEQVQDLQARISRLEADAFQALGILGHDCLCELRRGRRRECAKFGKWPCRAMLYFLPLIENLRACRGAFDLNFSMRPFVFPALVAASLLAGCSFDSLVSKVNPYKIDVRQGNYVDQDMMAQLKKGMTRDQVRFVLGTPLVVDVFRSDRWDYVYRFTPGRGEPQQRVISVYFVDDKLDRVDGDVQGGDATGAAESGRGERSRVVEVPAVQKK